MRFARQRGRENDGHDNVSQFISPNGGGGGRSAGHRFIPTEPSHREAIPARDLNAQFAADDFKPRWWPAPSGSGE